MDDNHQCDLLLVDGKNLFWRAISTSDLSIDGMQTSGIYTFIRSLIKVHEQFGGVIVVCWEGGRRQTLNRVKMYPEYKQRRLDPKRENELKIISKQLDKLINLLSLLGITQAKAPGWEADDAIATLAYRAKEKRHKVAIFSGDSDMFQCVCDEIFVIRHSSRDTEVIDFNGVQERLGVCPDQVPLLKALAGDRSDGIPGVDGIGDKGAVKIIEKFNDFNGVVDVAKSKQKPDISRFGDKAWESLCESASNGELDLWLKLAQVNSNADIEITSGKYNEKLVISELIDLKFKTMLRLRERQQLMRLTGVSS